MKILYATDGSEAAAAALWAALPLLPVDGARVTVLTVDERGAGAAGRREAAMRRAAEVLRSAGAEVGLMVRVGDAADEICRAAEELDADLVLLGSRGLGPVSQLAFGSVSTAVLHGGPRAVMVVQGDRYAR